MNLSFTFAPSGGQDGLLVCLDAIDGEVLDAVRIGGAERRGVADLVVDVDSAARSVIAVGTFDDCPYEGSSTPCAPEKFEDVFLARFDDDLVLRRIASFGSPGFQYGMGVALDPGRRVVLTGSFQNTIAFGAPTSTLTAASGSDVFVAAFDLPADLSGAFAPVWSVSYGSGGCATPYSRTGTDVAFGPPNGARSDVYVVGDFSADRRLGAALRRRSELRLPGARLAAARREHDRAGVRRLGRLPDGSRLRSRSGRRPRRERRKERERARRGLRLRSLRARPRPD